MKERPFFVRRQALLESRAAKLWPLPDAGVVQTAADRLAFARNHGVEVRIARYHNIFGPEGSWNDGKEKAPAAMCRKIAMAPEGGEVEIWGDGKQTRSFLYIDECLEGTLRLMRSSVIGPVNIGSEEMVTVDQLVDIVAEIAGKSVRKRYVRGPTGVRGRRSDNTLIREKLGWSPSGTLKDGLPPTYRWIQAQLINAAARSNEQTAKITPMLRETDSTLEGEIAFNSISRISDAKIQTTVRSTTR